MQNHDNSYNNADSFAIIFDEAWKRNDFNSKAELTTEQKINRIIEQHKDHPFIKSSPSQAIKVAKFRLRLLNLEK